MMYDYLTRRVRSGRIGGRTCRRRRRPRSPSPSPPSGGRRGLARGAVVVVLSDGWDCGDPAVLGAQMTRLHRLAFRVVWANPRKSCLLYTSDAADDLLCVDLGGR